MTQYVFLFGNRTAEICADQKLALQFIRKSPDDVWRRVERVSCRHRYQESPSPIHRPHGMIDPGALFRMDAEDYICKHPEEGRLPMHERLRWIAKSASVGSEWREDLLEIAEHLEDRYYEAMEERNHD